MRTATEWCGYSGTRYTATIYAVSEFGPADAALGVCLAIKRVSGTIADIARIVLTAARLSASGLSAWLGKARSAGASEIHVIAAASDAERTAIHADLKPE